jgi:hypothetical protein
MNKKNIRQWLDDSYDQGLISDEKYEQFSRELNSTQNPSEFWKSIRGEVSGLDGFVNVDKNYKSNADLADMIEKEIPNMEYENLTPANKRDIAKNLNVSIEDVDRGLEELWHRDLDKGIELGTKEANENKQIADEYIRAKTVKDSKLASNFGNQYAIKRYIEGAPDWEVALNEGLGILGEGTNFIPTQTTIGPVPVGAIAGAVDPLIRFGQRTAYTPSDNYDLTRELLRTGKDIVVNEGTGLVGGKAGRKFIGDYAAGALGAQGKIGKAMGDVVENTFEKFPKATPPIATGLMRKMLGGKNENVGDEAIAKAEENYKKAITETYKQYKPLWDKNQYLPDDNSSIIVKEAWKLYMENK